MTQSKSNMTNIVNYLQVSQDKGLTSLMTYDELDWTSMFDLLDDLYQTGMVTFIWLAWCPMLDKLDGLC